jgi:hypothetical protein
MSRTVPAEAATKLPIATKVGRSKCTILDLLPILHSHIRS